MEEESVETDDKKTGGRSDRRCEVEVVEAAKMLFIL